MTKYRQTAATTNQTALTCSPRQTAMTPRAKAPSKATGIQMMGSKRLSRATIGTSSFPWRVASPKGLGCAPEGPSAQQFGVYAATKGGVYLSASKTADAYRWGSSLGSLGGAWRCSARAFSKQDRQSFRTVSG